VALASIRGEKTLSKLGDGHYLYPDGAGLPLPGSGDRLGFAPVARCSPRGLISMDTAFCVYLAFYNQRRLRSALDGQTPDQAYFIQSPLAQAA